MAYNKYDIDEYFDHLWEYEEWEQRYLPRDPHEEQKQQDWMEYHKGAALFVFDRLTKITEPEEYKLGRNQNVEHNGEVYYISPPYEEDWKKLIVRGKQEICKKRECAACS